MENQKIQQLIRLASIADNNGDFRIADKIFNKLAQLPPRFTNKAPEAIDKYLLGILKTIEKLEKDISSIIDIIKIYENTQFSKWKTLDQAAIDKEFEFYNTLQKNIKQEKINLEQAEKQLKINPNDSFALQNKDAAEKAIQGDIDDIKKQQYDIFFGNMKKAPLSYKNSQEKLKSLRDELNDMVPDPTLLSSQKIDIDKLTAFFSTINTEKARRALELLKSKSRDPQKPDIEGVIKRLRELKEKAVEVIKKNPDLTVTPNNIYQEMMKSDGKYLNTIGLTKYDIEKFIEDGRIDADRIMLIKPQSKFMKAVSDFPEKMLSKYEEFINLRKARKNIPKQHPFFSLQNLKAYTSGAWDLSKEKIYQEHFADFIREIDIRLAEEYRAEVGKIKIRDGKYDPKNNAQFNEAFDKAQKTLTKSATQSPEAVAITGLFASMKDRFKKLQALAEDILMDPKDPKISKRGENVQLIREKMTQLDGRFMKTTGLSTDSVNKLITMGDLSIEDFLQFEGKKIIPNVKNETLILLGALLGASYLLPDNLNILKKALEFRRNNLPIPFIEKRRSNKPTQPATTQAQPAPAGSVDSKKALKAFNDL